MAYGAQELILVGGRCGGLGKSLDRPLVHRLEDLPPDGRLDVRGGVEAVVDLAQVVLDDLGGEGYLVGRPRLGAGAGGAGVTIVELIYQKSLPP